MVQRGTFDHLLNLVTPILTSNSTQAYDDWQQDPVLNHLKTTGLPISEIDFPAITICGQGLIDAVTDS